MGNPTFDDVSVLAVFNEDSYSMLPVSATVNLCNVPSAAVVSHLPTISELGGEALLHKQPIVVMNDGGWRCV